MSTSYPENQAQRPATIVQSIEIAIALLVLMLLIAGCLAVIGSFVWAALGSLILCFSTWPVFLRLRSLLHGNRSLAALVMTLGLAVIGIAPCAVIGWNLARHSQQIVQFARRGLHHEPPTLPNWAERLPAVQRFKQSWRDLASGNSDRKARIEQGLRELVINTAKTASHGVAQIGLSLLIGFFLYRDGEALAARLNWIIVHLAGPTRGPRLLTVAEEAVIGVIYGIIGTGLLHGLVALVGFFSARVPGALALSFLTFLFSFVPFGPALIWIPACLWLWHAGNATRAIVLMLWSLLAHGVVRNIIRPVLISRGGRMPLILVVLGVLGGVLAFGFIGIFLGPALLAIGYGLIEDWTSAAAPLAAEVKSPEAAALETPTRAAV